MKFLRSILNSAVIIVLASVAGSAELFPTAPPSASDGPVGRPYQDLRAYGKPDQMMDILPNRPVAAHDQSGNRLYYTPTGKLLMTVALDGTQTFSLRGKTTVKDAEGKITSTTEADKNDKYKMITKNEKGEITGTQTLDAAGRVTATYDANGNLTQVYQYNQFVKKVTELLDVMSMTRTVYDARGKAEYDVNFEGARVAEYKYDTNTGRLSHKIDTAGNKTYFTKEGRNDYTTDTWGTKLIEYVYKADAEGNSVLDHTKSLANDVSYGDVTYFLKDKPQYTDSSMGDRVVDYQYDGDTLLYSFNRRTDETTFVDKTGRSMFSTMNDNKVKEWIYDSGGRLMGFHDLANNTLTVYQYQRDEFTLQLQPGAQVPTGDELAKEYQDLSKEEQDAIKKRQTY
jgi:hypothetical protein